MPLNELSPEGMRWAVVILHLLEWASADITHATGMRSRDQQRWVQRWRETGAVEEAAGRGARTDRAPAIEEAKEKLKTVVEEDQYTSLSSKRLAGHVDVGARQVRRYMSDGDVALCFLPNETISALTPAHVEYRLQFCQQNGTRDWSHVVFSDSKVFVGEMTVKQANKQPRWQPLSGRRQEPCPKHPAYQLHVYGAISRWGAIMLIWATGTTGKTSPYVYESGKKKGTPHVGVCSKEYDDILRCMLPEIKAHMERHNRPDFFFQQDGASVHRVASCLSTIRECTAPRGRQLLGWPGLSADLSPIENVWAEVERKVWENGKVWNNLPEFAKRVEDTWQQVTSDGRYMRKLNDSMRKRCEQCVEAQGGKIKY